MQTRCADEKPFEETVKDRRSSTAEKNFNRCTIALEIILRTIIFKHISIKMCIVILFAINQNFRNIEIKILAFISVAFLYYCIFLKAHTCKIKIMPS